MELATFGGGSGNAALKWSSLAPGFLTAAHALENTDRGGGGGGGGATDVCRKRCRCEEGHARTPVARSGCSADRCQSGNCSCKRARTQSLPRPPTPPRCRGRSTELMQQPTCHGREGWRHADKAYSTLERPCVCRPTPTDPHSNTRGAHTHALRTDTHTCVTQAHTPSEAVCGGGGGGGGHLSDAVTIDGVTVFPVDGVTIATPTVTTADRATPHTPTSTPTFTHTPTSTHTDAHTTDPTHAHPHATDTHTASLHINTCTSCEPPHTPTVDHTHTGTHTTDAAAPPPHTAPHTPSDTPAHHTQTHTHTDPHTHTDAHMAVAVHRRTRRKSVTFAIPVAIIADEPLGPYSPSALASMAFKAELFDMDEISSNFASKLCHR